MNKLKWIILGILLLVLVVVIFQSPQVMEEDTPQNHANISVEVTHVNNDNKQVHLVEPGDYILYLDQFQKIQGNGTGWHIRFTRPAGDKEMVLIFDAVDTSGTIFSDSFPQKFSGFSPEKEFTANHPQLYRSSFQIGYNKRISENMFQEDLIPMMDFSCQIDTSWANDTTGGLRMHFTATHSSLLEEIYGARYSLTGTFQIDSAVLLNRFLP